MRPDTLKGWLKAMMHGAFVLGQRVGVNILPNHFYSPIPDIPSLRRDAAWRVPRSMVGVEGSDISQQLAYVRQCCQPHLVNRLAAFDIHGEACTTNGAIGFGPVESQFLYCFMVTHRPRHILQIGAGVATAVILRACRDEGFTTDITCVDPFPTGFLRRIASEGQITLIDLPAQQVSIEELSALNSGDLLFVDSTHAVKPASEVNRLILEVLPRLTENVFVHFHDILFPYDYGPRILDSDLFFWQESVLLHAFLIGNPRYSIRAALSMLHHAASTDLQASLPAYTPAAQLQGLSWRPSGVRRLLRRPALGHFPSSAYLQVAASRSVHA